MRQARNLSLLELRILYLATSITSTPIHSLDTIFTKSPLIRPKLLQSPRHKFARFRTDRNSFLQSAFAVIMLPSTHLILLLLSYAHLIACHNAVRPRAACSSSYSLCNPKGAATTNEPPVGTGIAPLFVDVVDTLDSAKLAKRREGQVHGIIETRASGGSLCCKYRASMTDLFGADSH